MDGALESCVRNTHTYRRVRLKNLSRCAKQPHLDEVLMTLVGPERGVNKRDERREWQILGKRRGGSENSRTFSDMACRQMIDG